MKIELHINRLVLDGVTADPGEITRAVHAELTRLLTAAPPGGWRQSTAPRVSGGEIRYGRSTASLGTGIARSIHQAVHDGH